MEFDAWKENRGRAGVQEARLYWTNDRVERVQWLGRRMEQLVNLKGRRAVREWRRFFREEMRMDDGADDLLALQRAVKEHRISERALQVILTEIESCEENFAARKDYPCVQFAGETADCCRERLSVYAEARKKVVSAWKRILISCTACAVLVFVFMSERKKLQPEEAEHQIAQMAAEGLNDKYDTDTYNIETVMAEQAEMPDENGDAIVYYNIHTDYSWDTSACVIPEQAEKAGTHYLIFDHMQSEEIKKAFEKRVNERTGCAEGRLYWDSALSNKFYGVEDGFFQTRYDGDFDAFFQQESKMREQVPDSATSYMDGDASARNGICEYYVPGPLLQIEEGKLEREFYAEMVRIFTELERCAKEYQVQITCIAVPDYLFEGTVEQAESGGPGIEEMRNAAQEYGYVFGE